MRYLIATAGASFIFVFVIIVGVLANAFLPVAIQRMIIHIPIGFIDFNGNPAMLIAAVLSIPCAVHSFRATLRRYPNPRAETPNE